jgi:hypothetical protein
MKISKSITSVAAALLFGMSAASTAGVLADSSAKFEKVASDTVSIHATQLFTQDSGAEVTGYVTLSRPGMQHSLGSIAITVTGADGKVMEQGYAILRPSSISKNSQARFEGYLAQAPAKDATITVSYVE